jgi:hypothetical protein
MQHVSYTSSVETRKGTRIWIVEKFPAEKAWKIITNN